MRIGWRRRGTGEKIVGNGGVRGALEEGCRCRDGGGDIGQQQRRH